VTAVHVIVPEGIHDPGRPSGGNAYDRRVCRGLAAAGWQVRERAVPGGWPSPDAAARVALGGELGAVPDGAVVLVDGLIASTVPEVLAPEAHRLRLAVLLHLPLGDAATADGARERECAALSAAAAVITTSRWGRRRLLELYPLDPGLVHVAEPGVDAADLAPGTAAGSELLCVAAVTPHKGQDVLLAAMGGIADLSWRCTCVGPRTGEAAFADRLARLAQDTGIADRVCFVGPRTIAALDQAYSAADALVLATRVESYGMVVSEALARGLPVLATSVGGLPEALGRLPGGRRPGLLVPPGDAAALAAALRRWLTDASLRGRLRHAARQRRTTLRGWPVTSDRVSRVLAGVSG
jgi:glycosyltransferase involved in cell wall biosynthesis